MHSSRWIRTLIVTAALLVFASTLVSVAAAASVGGINAVTFRDADNGYMAGWREPDANSRIGFFSVTDDGGATWSATLLPGTSQLAVAATGSGALGGGSFHEYLYRYADTSRLWTPKLPSGAWGEAGSASAGAGHSYLDVASVGTDLIVVGEREYNGKYAFIITSSDGGETWDTAFDGPEYPPVGDGQIPSTHASMASVDVAEDGTVWVIGNEWAQEGSGNTGRLAYKRRLAFKRAAGESNWSELTVPPGSGQQALSTVSAISATEMWAFGTAGQYAKTTDGGASWTQGWLPTAQVPAMNILASDGRGSVRVMVGHYQTGLTTYQRKLSRSTNGGASWTTTTVAGSGPLRDVLMFSDSNWIAVGDNETILRTANGGVSWTGHTSLQRPQVSLTAPAQGDHLTAMPVSIAGTSTDVGVGVASVEYQVKRADGKSLDGASGWATTDTWLQAQTSDGWRHWTANWTPDALTLSAGMSVEIRARATDALGATSAAIQPIVMTNQSVVDTVAPTVTFTSPSAYFSKSVSQLRFVGTASDSVSGLSETRMSIMRSGRYWDHDNRSWTASETWIPASALGSSSAWAYTWLLDATTKNGTAVATVTVESEDRAGNVRRVTSIARPKTKPYLTYPAATYRATSTGPLLTGLPKYARYGKYYYAVGYAKHTPSHSVGVKAGVLEAYRYEKQRNGTYKWIRRKTWTAPAYTLGRYRVRITLPRGTWRLRIVHAEDAVALSGVSSMRTIYVR